MINDKPLTTPVLFIIFNRPEVTQSVFNEIRRAKPLKLFVAADGPRDNKNEHSKCEETRSIIEQVDWDCSLKTLFRERNLGCKIAVSSAISWFLENAEEGIILEDDCLPSQSFFWFCQELLEVYRNDSRVLMISGFNVLGEWKSDLQDYFFSDGGIWGWATWRRAWKHFDTDLKLLDQPEAKRCIRDFLMDENIYSIMIHDSMEVDSWDYKWAFVRMINSALSIAPSKNMIRNIGFGPEATHTTVDIPPLSKLPLCEMTFPLRRNEFMVIDREFGTLSSQRMYPERLSLLTDSPPLRLRVRTVVVRAVRRVFGDSLVDTVKTWVRS